MKLVVGRSSTYYINWLFHLIKHFKLNWISNNIITLYVKYSCRVLTNFETSGATLKFLLANI